MAEVYYGGVYAPSAVSNQLDRLVEMYQGAFAARPWQEVSKCPSETEQANCPDGLSRVAVGSICEVCQLCPTEPAFPTEELKAKFTFESKDTHSLWYLEKDPSGTIALATLARVTTAEALAREVYGDDPEMQQWISEKYPEETTRITWISDIFADTTIRPKGNLANFGDMCRSLTRGSRPTEVLFRTINPRIVSAAQRDFGKELDIADPAFGEVPNRGRMVSFKIDNNVDRIAA